ncbi:MAG: DUF3794 domain-containing protein [Ruminococcaceae bacterium]|nr:DUF3794 domain-containing protein [Oscillospiraceae bacterium]
MELELRKERFDCFCPGTPIISTREETSETIVPDYSPDIARIIDVSACLLLRSQSAGDGKANMSGAVKLTLLYMAEDTQGLRSLEYSIPFEQSEKIPDGCDKAVVEGRVCGVEARLLNPRKLFTRLEIEWKVTPYCRTTLSTCGEIVDQASYAIQTLCEKHDVSLIRCVSDKDFTFSDELSIPAGREPISELLCSRAKLRVTEAKSVGSKAIVKGTACLSLLYAAEDGKLCTYSEELPFSQILDGVAAEETGSFGVSAALNLSGCEIHTLGEDGGQRTVSVKLLMHASIVLRQTEQVDCIIDLYSTSYELNAQTESVELWQEPEITSVTQNVREQIDTGSDVRCVLGTDVCFGGVNVTQNGSHAAVRAAATLSLLYQDEAGAVRSVQRRIEIAAETEVSGEAQAAAENVCTEDVSANINASGVELRFPAEFTLVSVAAPQCASLVSLSAEQTERQEGGDPSLVLRVLDESETLWDVAKRYRTTVEEILSANELTDGAAPEAGRMLLIPRKR